MNLHIGTSSHASKPTHIKNTSVKLQISGATGHIIYIIRVTFSNIENKMKIM